MKEGQEPIFSAASIETNYSKNHPENCEIEAYSP